MHNRLNRRRIDITPTQIRQRIVADLVQSTQDRHKIDLQSTKHRRRISVIDAEVT